MNKIKILILTMLAAFLLVGCGEKPKEQATETEVEENNEIVEETPETEEKITVEEQAEEIEKPEETTSESGLEKDIKVDKSSEDVEVTVPAGLVLEGEEDIDTFIEENKKAEDVKDIIYNEEEQTVTYIMTKEKHQEMMSNIETGIKDTIDQLIADESNSILSIDHSDDYSNFDVFVDPNKYSEEEVFNAFSFFMSGSIYRAFNGDSDTKVVVNFIDNETKEVLYTSDSDNMFGN